MDQVQLRTSNTDTVTLLTVQDVAEMLRCSTRTVYRLCDSGQMPKALRLNGLVRWRRDVVEQWIAGGCPKVGKEVC
jgi:excisionase family DNA binding protein